ncbi:kinase-like domain-containing protein [Roridomyces roridus]|uniref:Kinase-like domain-containing protein n=1 Tax=Roridomyces roridus TaxID=1738132 RepID=A0AAD7CB08_9AGAR|nr:kinase-like domain-containing protein [Roridomyces roridus]
MEEIGSGTSSIVYLVNCKRGRLRNRQVALRKISSLPSSSALHQSLSHPCIVTLFSTFSAPSAHFHLLELCSGGPLAKYLEDNTLNEAHLRGLLKSLVDALIYLKKQGILHRNIKPSNILLTSDRRIKLGDFDLATRLPPSKLPLDCFDAQPHFVAPEILAGHPYSFDSDIFSAGCTSLACLSGRCPSEVNLPENASLEAQDLMARMVETVGVCGHPLDLLQHIFKDPKQRIELHAIPGHPFFEANLPVTPLGENGPKLSNSILSKHALFESVSGSKQDIYSRRKRFLNNTANDDLRGIHRLRHEASTKRIVSDPLPLKKSLDLSELSLEPFPRRVERPVTQDDDISDNPVSALCHRNHLYLTAQLQPIPIGTTRPVPFTTMLLAPEVHKTVHGQVTILPSHSLLVDLREGERRRGQKGVEVLLISPSGTEIEIYSAPHLSLPCCLAEPTKKYTVDSLPSAYWRQYNDAGLLVERIKQRTPKLMLHTGVAKCTLMANSPPADIELLFGSADGPRMRIRLSRQSGSWEIAKHTSGARGEEWTKKVLRTIDEPPFISLADWDALEAIEQENVVHVVGFLRSCDALEQLECQDHSISFPYSKRRRHTPLPTSVSSTQSLSTFNFLPRPPKLAVSQIDVDPLLDKASVEGQHLSVLGKTVVLPTWCKDDLDFTAANQLAPQTKFIPSVGWCIRHGSRVSQGGRYKIMFFDGTVLEIDVDEDWAELTPQSGETTRCHPFFLFLPQR